MKAMMAAFLAVIVIMAAADRLLDHAGMSTMETTSGPAVRNH